MRKRVESRARRCGEDTRHIPEDVLAASLAAPALTLRALTPHVDFVARITNESANDPELEALEAVDSSGDWGAISKRFGGSYTSPSLHAAASALSLASSVDDDPEATPPRRPASPRAEISALKLQAENDRRTIDGLRASLRAAEERLAEALKANGRSTANGK